MGATMYMVQTGFVALNAFRLHNGFRTAVAAAAQCLLMIFADMTIFIDMHNIRCLASVFYHSLTTLNFGGF